MLYGIKLYSIARTSHCFLTCSATSDMLPSTLLIFDLDGTRFGLDATLVRESVWLPELTPVEEAPPHIAGIFSLRGQIVPVTDLHLRFGHPARPYCISDQIVVLELDQLLIGLIVSEVREVIEVSLDAIKPPPKFDGEAHAHLVEGEVRVGDDIVTLLDVSQLVRQPQAPSPANPLSNSLPEGERAMIPLSPWERGGGEGSGVPAHHFCPQATPEERAVFHERARSLMETAAEEEGARLSLAVVELGGEYFGIELETVQEFCDIVSQTKVGVQKLNEAAENLKAIA